MTPTVQNTRFAENRGLATITETGPEKDDEAIELLAKIASNAKTSAAATSGYAPSVQCTATSTAYTNSGSTGSGAWQIQCQNIGTADGTFNGATVPAGKFAAPLTAPPGTVLPSIDYNGTGTRLVITVIGYF